LIFKPYHGADDTGYQEEESSREETKMFHRNITLPTEYATHPFTSQTITRPSTKTPAQSTSILVCCCSTK
jgi:hypothetical protein